MLLSSKQIARHLRSLVKGEVFADIRTRTRFSRDGSIYEILPAVVVCPRSTMEVSRIIQYAAENKIPIAPRGRGTGLAGESLTQGIVLDCVRYLNRIDPHHPNKKQIRIQPGVILGRLNQRLRRTRKKFGPDPASEPWCTMGGVLANNSTGAHSIRFGSARDHIVELECVLADGSIQTFTKQQINHTNRTPLEKRIGSLLKQNQTLINKNRPRTSRNTCGYRLDNVWKSGDLDLTKLIVGSEGTLGIITRATVNLVDVPQKTGLVLATFRNLETALQAVDPILQTKPAAVELLDSILLKLARRRVRGIVPALAEAVLYIEHDGDDIESRLAVTEEICKGIAISTQRAIDAGTQAQFWNVRSHAVPMLERLSDSQNRVPISFIEDTTVLPRDLPLYVSGVKKILSKYKKNAVFYAHAGDGELHIRPFLNVNLNRDVRQMERIAQEVYELVWSLGGSIGGEHATGLLRTQFIRYQYGDDLYNVFAQVKHAFDPLNILNPGKLVSDDPHLMTKNITKKPLRWRY